MEIIAKIILFEDVKRGSGYAKNADWQNQNIVIKTDDEQTLIINAYGGKVEDLKQYSINDIVKVTFVFDAKRYEGKYYNSLKMLSIKKIV